jgi:mannose/cellobiose epimerase-like protein (N-acyl-D-glucosamine 2-epimerase family)
VTRSSARKLWHYAIIQKESRKYQINKIKWQGNIGLLGHRRRDSYIWYDLAMREDDQIHIYYGVTDSGLNDDWVGLIQQHTL